MMGHVGDMNKTLGNFGGPWPLIVNGRTWELNYPDEKTLNLFVLRVKRLAMEVMDLAMKYMSKEASALLCSVLGSEMGPQRLYEWGGEKCQEHLVTGDGLSYLVFLLLRPNHKDITEDEARQVVKDSLQENPPGLDADGNVVENPYILRTILELADQGKSKPPTRTAAAH